MPLVNELTRQIKEWLTPAKLQELAAGWEKQGKPVPEQIVNALSSRLSQDENYERLIAWAQEQRWRAHGADTKHWSFLVIKLQQIVGKLLVLRHSERALREALPRYSPLAAAVPAGEPLWIFSLNHDLCIELLAAELGIPVSCGYDEVAAVTFSATDGRRVAFDRISREKLARHELDFPTTRGINLVKLHGSLEVFAYNDKLDYLRMHPTEMTALGWIEELTRVDQKLNSNENGRPVAIVGEIAVFDDAGVLQFLRPTLVAGGFKFEGRGGYNAPGELVEFFARKLTDFDELVVVGYSWCDRHVNEPIERWLAGEPTRRVVFVNPSGLPLDATPLEARIEIVRTGACDWLRTIAKPVQ